MCPTQIVTRSIDLPEYQAATPEQVAAAKVLTAVNLVKGPVLIEDVSLCFGALSGLPGAYIKWFLKSLGPDGLYKLVEPHADHSAYALCICAFHDGNHYY